MMKKIMKKKDMMMKKIIKKSKVLGKPSENGGTKEIRLVEK